MIDNAYMESFNGRLREECLNAYCLLSSDDARDKNDAWRRFYNERRPHTALDGQTPNEFARLPVFGRHHETAKGLEARSRAG
jgi:putative transposase